MRVYKFNAYEKKGKLITEETFEAENDDEAKVKGQAIIEANDFYEVTHRLASPAGKLLLFHT